MMDWAEIGCGVLSVIDILPKASIVFTRKVLDSQCPHIQEARPHITNFRRSVAGKAVSALEA